MGDKISLIDLSPPASQQWRTIWCKLFCFTGTCKVNFPDPNKLHYFQLTVTPGKFFSTCYFLCRCLGDVIPRGIPIKPWVKESLAVTVIILLMGRGNWAEFWQPDSSKKALKMSRVRKFSFLVCLLWLRAFFLSGCFKPLWFIFALQPC